MKTEITNIRISASEHTDRWAVSCEYGGASYHVAVNRRTGELEPDGGQTHRGKITLYKSPAMIPDEKNPGQPRSLRRFVDAPWFRTVKLDAKGATGRKIIPAMLANIMELLSEGEMRVFKQAQEEAEKAAAGRRAKALSNNVEAMYAILRDAANPMTHTHTFHRRAKELYAKIAAEAKS